MRIGFFGTPDYAVAVLRGLIEAGHDICIAATQPDKAKDRGKKVQFTPVKELALSHNIPVLQPEKVRGNEEFFEELKKADPELIVVVAYGQIIPQNILDLPKYGCVNVHASLLPVLRGAAPIQRSIIEGHEKTGVTIMQMGAGLDTGDMLSKAEIEIGTMNYEQLHDKLAEMGTKLLIDTIPHIEDGTCRPEKQDDSISTYAHMIKKQDGKIDFKKTPKEIEQLIRGFDPWPGAFCTYKDDITMKLWKAEALDEKTDAGDAGKILKVSKDSFDIAAGEKTLRVYEIQVPGKKRVLVSDYLKGNKIEAGEILK